MESRKLGNVREKNPTTHNRPNIPFLLKELHENDRQGIFYTLMPYEVD